MQNAAFDGNESGVPSDEKSNQQIYDSLVEGNRLSPARPTNDAAQANEERGGNTGEGKRELHSSGEQSGNKYDDQPSILRKKPKVSPPSHWHASIAAVSGSFLFIGVGCAFSWSSSTEKYFVGGGMVDKYTWGWIAGFTPFGAIFTPISAGLLTEKLGRKWCLLGSGTFLAISWVIVGLAKGATVLLIGRFLGGMALGAATVVFPLYINEIATDQARSVLGSLLKISTALGVLLSYAVGPYVDPLVLAIFSGAWPVLHVVSFLAMPESPIVLVKRGDRKGAAKALAWLRGQTESEVADELDSIQMFSDKREAEKIPYIRKVISVFTKRPNRKAFLISILVTTFVQSTGVSPIAYYTQSIFESTGSHIDAATSAILLGAVKFVAAMGCAVLAKFFSMKALLTVSAFGMAAGHGAVGFYFFEKDRGDVSGLAYLPLVGLLTFILLYSIGYGPLPYALTGELQGAGDAKEASMGLCYTHVWTLTFLFTSLFPAVNAMLGSAGTFLFLAVNCIVAGIFTIWLVPNTRNKSLEEIRHYLDK